MWGSIRFAEEIGVTFPSFYILQAYPGTEVWNENVANGRIEEDRYWETGVSMPEVASECVPTGRIKAILSRGYQHFLTRPGFVLDQVGKVLVDPVRRQIIMKNLSLRKMTNLIKMLRRSEHYY